MPIAKTIMNTLKSAAAFRVSYEVNNRLFSIVSRHSFKFCTMKVTESPSHISLDTLHHHLSSYDSHVPDKIRGLEELRISTIPETLVQRKRDGKPFLEKTEVISLVEWKLCVRPAKPFLRKLRQLTAR